MLGEINLRYYLNGCPEPYGNPDDPEWQQTCHFVDWTICGGETGLGAREMKIEWAQDLRNQCKSAGVPFFFKQMSKKAPIPKDLIIRELPEG